jgi:3-mercaptopropionate dioxygenase
VLYIAPRTLDDHDGQSGERRGAPCATLFSVVALVLRPGQSTPIHDHVTWCAFGVIQGAEREERYVQGQDGHLELAAISANLVGDVDGLAPPGDIHLERNDDVPAAISLHIYGTDVSRLGTSVRRVYDAPIRSGRVRVRPAGR